MTQTQPEPKTFITRNRAALQTGALLAILVMPVLLYGAAEANLPIGVTVLLGINALLMLVVALWLT